MARSMSVSGLADALAARGVPTANIQIIVERTRHPKVTKRLVVGRLREALCDISEVLPRLREVDAIIKEASQPRRPGALGWGAEGTDTAEV